MFVPEPEGMFTYQCPAVPAAMVNVGVTVTAELGMVKVAVL